MQQLPLFFTLRQTKVNNPENLSIDLNKIWHRLIAIYFPKQYKKLKAYNLQWSKRKQKRTLASCNLHKKVVTVAKELNNPKYHIWLEPLLFHEMCHAVIGNNIEKNSKGQRLWHGPTFKRLESQHPLINDFNKWISNGGWLQAIKSSRQKEAWQKKTKTNKALLERKKALLR